MKRNLIYMKQILKTYKVHQKMICMLHNLKMVFIWIWDHMGQVNQIFLSQKIPIKFKNITFRDPDRSISRVEIQDDRGYRYSCSLISEYTDTFSIEVNGLESDTSYILQNYLLHQIRMEE